MVIARLSGGLGNQFFQYAAAKSLAIHTKSKICLDISFYEESPNRIFELDKFNIQASILNSNQIKSAFNIKQGFFKSIFETKVNSLNLLKKYTYFEKQFHFDKDFFLIKEPVILDGYWQSELFFQDYINEFISDFTFVIEPVIQYDLAKYISSYETVALHIRRGDFALNPEINKIHGICSDNYYLEAVNFLKNYHPDLRTLIFSDDSTEGRRIGSMIENSTLIDSNEDTYYDFFVMQKCNHNIIANSSFSWWAAYLNQNKNKKIIAPQNWFADSSLITNDLFPPTWIKL
jgi:hypothetical protein